MVIFLVHIFDAWLQTICNEAESDILLHRYKRNWSIAYGLPESRSVIRVALAKTSVFAYFFLRVSLTDL